MVDCKLMFLFMEDLKRQRMMCKVKESGYIFMMKSAISNSKKAAIRAKNLRDESRRRGSFEVQGIDHKNLENLKLN